MYILVAEDSPINQNIVNKMLARLGHEADFANDGLNALLMMRSKHYHLVLMDCEMPGMDGYAVTRSYRSFAKQQNLPHTPIIALTAHALPEYREKAADAGMDDFIAKPLRLEQLKQTLEQWGTKMTDSDDGTNTPATMELDKLEVLLGKDEADVILEAFAEYAPEQLSELKALYEQRDAEQLYKKAHQFKGESIQVGANRLSELCKQLEMSGRKDDLSDTPIQLQLLEAELTNVLQALRIFLSE